MGLVSHYIHALLSRWALRNICQINLAVLFLLYRPKARWYHYLGDFFNTLKAFIGTNYLALAFAFKQSGLIVSYSYCYIDYNIYMYINNLMTLRECVICFR